ncbi:radical SAM protein [bacterium]|nr:radical SAM protein [bacterium]
MAKLLLIQPPVQDFYDTDVRLQPIGLSFLKAALHKHLPMLTVKIIDAHHGHGKKTIPVPKELAYLKDYYAHPDKSPFCTFHHYYHFGASFEQIASWIKKEKPDVVGISCLFSPYYREALEVACVVKSVANIPVIVGGSHVSAHPQSMIESPYVDFAITGEGEKPLVEWMKVFLEGSSDYSCVPNLIYKQDGQVITNQKADNYLLDEIPMPDLSDFNPATYRYGKKPMAFVITSRSCPHRCSFCSVHQTFGFSYRRRSVPLVLEEIQARYHQGYRVFDFEDDNLTFYKKEMKELLLGIMRLFPKKDVELVAMNGISYLSLDDELLGLMKEAGFTHLNLALVSSDKSVRETTKRPHTLEKYLAIVEKAHALGLKITSYQILGLPSETLDSMIQTLSFNAKLPVLLGASPFYLTPNAPLARELNITSGANDIFKARLTAFATPSPHFTQDDIYTLFVTTRILNFMKGERVGTRYERGKMLLSRLLAEKTLFADTPLGFQPNTKFKYDVFKRVWDTLYDGQTQTQGRARDCTGNEINAR